MTLPLSCRNWFHAVLGASAMVLLAVACWWTLRLSLANHAGRQETAAALARAIRLSPDDAALWARYAAVSVEAESVRALNAEVALNPADWASWVRLGVAAEERGDLPAAEQSYRQAASVNRQFQPAWILANYFFRRSDRKQFAEWAGRALPMAHGDARPVFDLCWRADPAPALVLRAISGRPDLLRQYLAYLTAEGRLAAAGKAADQALKQAQKDDVPELLAFCDRLLEASSASRAAAVWNELSRRRLIPHRTLDPARGLSLTNGDFDAAPSSMGFDWRIVPWNGVSVAHVPADRILRVAFTGDQPESCEVLTQYVPISPGRSYSLSYDYRTLGESPETGLRWRVYRAGGDTELADAAPQLSSEKRSRQETHFSTASGDTLVKLALVYQRARGTTRFEGSLWLQHIRLD